MTGKKDKNTDDEDKTKAEADAARLRALAKSYHVQMVMNRIRAAKAKREALKKAKPVLNQ